MANVLFCGLWFGLWPWYFYRTGACRGTIPCADECSEDTVTNKLQALMYAGSGVGLVVDCLSAFKGVQGGSRSVSAEVFMGPGLLGRPTNILQLIVIFLVPLGNITHAHLG